MTRKQAIQAIKAAGTENDKRAFLRLYVENRISLAVAKAAFSEGAKFAAFCAARANS